MNRLRILLSAYQCGPGEGSVSQIGWEWYSRLAQYAAVTLVTHVRNRAALEKEAPPAPDAQIIYVDTEAFAGPLYRLASRVFPRSQHSVFLISSLDFFVFDRQAVRTLKKMQNRGCAWDIAHCVTPVSPIASPTVHRLGVPVVLGPWNGGLKSPDTFPEFMNRDSAWLYPIRNLGRVAEFLNRGIARSSLVLTATIATDHSLYKRYRHKVQHMLENGVDLANFCATDWPIPPSPGHALQVLFVGRLVPFKGVSMLLEAVKNVSISAPVKLCIVGDGPERVPLERQAVELGISHSVSFLGNRTLREVSAAMQRAHVFCLPSVRESGGAVLLEAMATARPVIAVSYGGPAELVTDEVGHGIAPIGRSHVVEQLTTDLVSVIQDPEMWKRKGLEGRTRAEREFSWDAKIEQALLVYQQQISNVQTYSPPQAIRGVSDEDFSSAASKTSEKLRTTHE
jgi:glycosyltransferase involved in cell wall biosynthesis